MVQVNSDTSISIDSPQGRKLFVFDRVFSPEVTQDGVWDYLTDSVNAFTTGYNVSLLAYGQSGAGKSYTMGTSGPTEQGDPEIMGTYFFDEPFQLFTCAFFPLILNHLDFYVLLEQIDFALPTSATFLTANPGLTHLNRRHSTSRCGAV